MAMQPWRFVMRQLQPMSLVTIRQIKRMNFQLLPMTTNNAAVMQNSRFQQKRFIVHQTFTMKTVEDRIMLILSVFDKIDATKLTMDSDFFKDLGLDSLDFVEMIMAIEDDFMFEIPDGDSDRMRTPRDIYQYICDKNDVYH